MNQEERNHLYLESFRQAQEEVSAASDAKEAAERRLEKATATFQAWKTITEQAGLELQPTTRVPTTTAPPMPTQHSAAIDNEPLNKANFVRKVIEGAGIGGITSGEIKAAAIQAGIEMYTGYPYTVLNRLKEQGRVTQNARGRYIAATK
jgi:hypothetical protein